MGRHVLVWFAFLKSQKCEKENIFIVFYVSFFFGFSQQKKKGSIVHYLKVHRSLWLLVLILRVHHHFVCVQGVASIVFTASSNPTSVVCDCNRNEMLICKLCETIYCNSYSNGLAHNKSRSKLKLGKQVDCCLINMAIIE